MQALVAKWYEESMRRSQLAALLELRYGASADLTPDQLRVARFLDDIAIQQQIGRRPAHFIWEFLGFAVLFWWPALASRLQREREATGEQRLWTRVERMYGEMLRVQRTSGTTTVDPTEGVTAATLDPMIQSIRTELEHLRDARAGVVPSLPAERSEVRSRQRRSR